MNNDLILAILALMNQFHLNLPIMDKFEEQLQSPVLDTCVTLIHQVNKDGDYYSTQTLVRNVNPLNSKELVGNPPTLEFYVNNVESLGEAVEAIKAGLIENDYRLPLGIQREEPINKGISKG